MIRIGRDILISNDWVIVSLGFRHFKSKCLVEINVHPPTTPSELTQLVGRCSPTEWAHLVERFETPPRDQLPVEPPPPTSEGSEKPMGRMEIVST